MITPNGDQIGAYEAAGLVTVREHKDLPLRIVNYTPRVQYERCWTAELLQCRGLVVDADWNVVARPLPKFFNYEEHLGENAPAGPLPEGPYTVTEKYDGSLGIVFRWNGHLVVATRGSFHSDQARMGLELLHARYDADSLGVIQEGVTHLFEIIHPENRIVVDYGGERYMQWLTSVRVSDGVEQPQYGAVFGHPESYPPLPPMDLKRQGRPNAEGYVLRFSTGQRVKIKFDQYVELHRLVTGLDSVAIWECLCSGKNPLEALTNLPDELYAWAQEETDKLHKQHAQWMEAVQAKCEAIVTALPEPTSRRDFAMVAKNNKYPHLLFIALDKNMARLSDAIWKEIKPERRKPVTGTEC